MKIRIGIDASGGDRGPINVVSGAFQAASFDPKIQVVIFGKKSLIDSMVPVHLKDGGDFEVIDCENWRSELTSAFRHLADGQIHAVVTASNSLHLAVATRRFLPAKHLRLGLLAPCPTEKEEKLAYFIDAGATARISDPKVFVFWAQLGREFLIRHLGIADPIIGLLNIAEERADPETLKIDQTLRAISDFNYIGYLEPQKILAGDVDLTLMSGREGNLLLKSIESTAKLVISRCRQVVKDLPQIDFEIQLLQKSLFSYDAFLISPILGLGRWAFRVHGHADSQQIAQALSIAHRHYPVTTPQIEESQNAAVRIEQKEGKFDEWKSRYLAMIEHYQAVINEKAELEQALQVLFEENLPGTVLVRLPGVVKVEIVPGSTLYQQGVRFTQSIGGVTSVIVFPITYIENIERDSNDKREQNE